MLGSGSRSRRAAEGVGMVAPVLEKAPALEMKLASAINPSAVPRMVDRSIMRIHGTGGFR